VVEERPVSDLHARLVAELNRPWEVWAPKSPGEVLGRIRLALRAVVELHSFRPCQNAVRDNHPLPGNCAGCDPLNEDSCDSNPWPCSTIQVIARELGLADA
jgi:hypothetical protein